MPSCAACGAELGEDASFCARCHKPVASLPARTPAIETSGIPENIAGLLCYAAGWLTGLLFFLMDKRPSVRFHAMQSILTFGLLNVFYGIVAWNGGFAALRALLAALTLGCGILCMLKAHRGLRYKLPIIGDLAENYSR